MNSPRHSIYVTIVAAATVALLFWSNTLSMSCDTWVSMQDVTADGSVILAKNSDRPPMEAQPLVHCAGQKHRPQDKVKCTYIEIPQVPETYEHIGSKIWWTFGYEHGLNEHGVAIGNEAVWSKEPYQWGDGLLGMDLLRLGLERGKTAHEAMHVIIGLLQEYGQCGDCEREGEWGDANYHNSFLIADPKEAWVLETAGRYWVAKRITRGVYSISNIYSIENDWDEAHPNLVQHAIERGWAESAEGFNFARAYGDYWKKESPNPGAMQIRRNSTLSCLRADSKRISPASMMRVNRSHHEGTIAEPRWGAADCFWATPCMHDSPRSRYHTAASIVAHLRADMPPLLRQVYWAGFSNPCCGVFQPFYLRGPRVPANYAAGSSTYAADSPWWQANRVKLLCDLNYRALNPKVRAVFDVTEKWEMGRQRECEAEVIRLVDEDKTDAAVERLQQFINENCARAQQEYRVLNAALSRMLEAEGAEYLYTGYLKEWSRQKGVPLPGL